MEDPSASPVQVRNADRLDRVPWKIGIRCDSVPTTQLPIINMKSDAIRAIGIANVSRGVVLGERRYHLLYNIRHIVTVEV